MFALAYVSQASRHFEQSEFNELVSLAKHKNQQLLVTGFLSYKDEYFLQYLEGEESAVRALMDTIEQDGRHRILQTVNIPNIGRRRFNRWHMRYWTHNELIQISMIDLLQDVVLYMDAQIYGEQRLRDRIIKLVGKLAEWYQFNPSIE